MHGHAPPLPYSCPCTISVYRSLQCKSSLFTGSASVLAMAKACCTVCAVFPDLYLIAIKSQQRNLPFEMQ